MINTINSLLNSAFQGGDSALGLRRRILVTQIEEGGIPEPARISIFLKGSKLIPEIQGTGSDHQSAVISLLRDFVGKGKLAVEEIQSIPGADTGSLSTLINAIEAQLPVEPVEPEEPELEP